LCIPDISCSKIPSDVWYQVLAQTNHSDLINTMAQYFQAQNNTEEKETLRNTTMCLINNYYSTDEDKKKLIQIMHNVTQFTICLTEADFKC